jgi:hypothetical protein
MDRGILESWFKENVLLKFSISSNRKQMWMYLLRVNYSWIVWFHHREVNPPINVRDNTTQKNNVTLLQ